MPTTAKKPFHSVMAHPHKHDEISFLTGDTSFQITPDGKCPRHPNVQMRGSTVDGPYQLDSCPECEAELNGKLDEMNVKRSALDSKLEQMDLNAPASLLDQKPKATYKEYKPDYSSKSHGDYKSASSSREDNDEWTHPSKLSLEALSQQMNRMQQMQDWLLQQKEQEMLGLKQKVEEQQRELLQKEVELALLKEKLAQQEARMQHELKIIKHAATKRKKKKKNRDKDGQPHKEHRNEAAGVAEGVAAAAAMAEPRRVTREDSRGEMPMVSQAYEEVEAQEEKYYNHRPKEYSNRRQDYYDDEEEEQEEEEAPKKYYDNRDRDYYDDQEEEEETPQKYYNNRDKDNRDRDYYDNQEEEEEEEEEQAPRKKSPPPIELEDDEEEEEEDNYAKQDTFDVNANMHHQDIMMEPTFEGNSGDYVSQKYGNISNLATGNQQDSDAFTIGNTVASSTYGEDRHKVVNQTVLDPYGDSGQYTGVVLLTTGMPHGLGRMKYEDDGRTYDGDWRHGRWHGFGRATFANGDSYEGEYRFDQRHGKGLYKWHDGREYNGDFHEDKRHGRGFFVWPDGATYEGDFVYGQREGHGKYTFCDGGQYIGDWVDGRYEGYGECEWEDGRTYKGEWTQGMAHGRGIETFADGTVRHDGMWEMDDPIE